MMVKNLADRFTREYRPDWKLASNSRGPQVAITRDSVSEPSTTLIRTQLFALKLTTQVKSVLDINNVYEMVCIYIFIFNIYYAVIF